MPWPSEGGQIFLFVTLDKSGMPEDHRHGDRFLARDLFGRKGQSGLTQESRAGQMLRQHREKGIPIPLPSSCSRDRIPAGDHPEDGLSDPRSIHVVGAAILDGEHCLVAQRGPTMSLPEKWEFPGGKVERGEPPAVALARELEEELGLHAEVSDWLGRGESIASSERVVLDVYAASLSPGSLCLREHARARWVREEELPGLDWADADVPVLPAVRARMRARPKAHHCGKSPVIVSVDWGRQTRKRAVYVARPSLGWEVARLEPPHQGWNLDRLLELARRLRDEQGTAVLIGVDAVLGVPTAFARAAGTAGFLDVLQGLDREGGLREEVASPSAWKPERPFFRVLPRKGGLTEFVEAAGGRSAVLRQIELRTGAKPVFALSGIPGSVGSGSRVLWQELAPLARNPDRELYLWPFDGSLAELTSRQAVVLAEVYPRAAYSIALSNVLPAPLRPLAKTVAAERSRALHELQQTEWRRARGVELRDLDAAQASEDEFDALVTATALVRLVSEGRPLAHELVDPWAEGGILATGDMVLPEPKPSPAAARRRAPGAR